MCWIELIMLIFFVHDVCFSFHFFKIEDIEESATTIKELYELIDNYKVPTPPEDLAVYQVHRIPILNLLLFIII